MIDCSEPSWYSTLAGFFVAEGIMLAKFARPLTPVEDEASGQSLTKIPRS
ncbi:hypothetical protein D082_24520 [Synechocystis sp. PCC 6714]|nr:hypothetical protein D082_24520 [Synechocystis sp. PCC 6714]